MYGKVIFIIAGNTNINGEVIILLKRCDQLYIVPYFHTSGAKHEKDRPVPTGATVETRLCDLLIHCLIDLAVN